METIYIVGDIDEAAFKRFDVKLSRIERTIHPNTRIDIVLSSGGGNAYDAIAFFDRIKSFPFGTGITCYGTAFSAALLILAAGTYRRMGRNAWAMAHEDLTDVEKYHKVTEAEKVLAHSRRLEKQWCKILASVTKASAEKWEELHKNETYLSAEECLELGLIDEILGE